MFLTAVNADARAPLATAFKIPLIVLASMAVLAAIIFIYGGPHPLGLIPGYVLNALQIQLVAVLAVVGLRIVASLKTGSPIRQIRTGLRDRAPLLLLPVVVFPLFLACFTAVKSALAHLAGFRFDRLFADLDLMIFGIDPWRLTHFYLGSQATFALEYVYVWGWILVIGYVNALIPLLSRPQFITRYYAASMAMWIVGGVFCAYLLASAGPTFAHMVDPEFAQRFAPLKASLAALLPASSPFNHGPLYLEEGIRSWQAYPGGGISAMPSMHIASAVLLAIAAGRSMLAIPAWLFVAILAVGSVHSGYHYAVDAILAAIIALACWKLAASVAEPLSPAA